jgi:medium-chain acyl-[acyl-carrier-protein] hydrolase
METTLVTAINDWLPYQKPDSRAAIRLFCFPYAGGNALVYRKWLDGLPSFVEVCPVQLPGRGKRLQEKPLTRLTDVVEAVADAIRPQLDRPFALFGHSMGAMISFELARLLRREGERQPSHLFLSGRRAPQFPRTDPPTFHLPEPEFLEKLRELNGTPAEVLEHEELMRLMIPLLRADFEVVQTYDYVEEPPLNCSISVYGGLQDDEVATDHLKGWRAHTASSFELRMFPGNHFFINTAQPLLMQKIATDLQRLVR